MIASERAGMSGNAATCLLSKGRACEPRWPHWVGFHRTRRLAVTLEAHCEAASPARSWQVRQLDRQYLPEL